MANGLNKVMLIGNLGKDPQHRIVGGDKDVCNFSIGCSERYKQGDDWKDKTEWVNIVVWGRQAKSCAEYLDKGSKVYIEGKLQTRKYDKDGETKYITEVNAQKILFLDSKKQGNNPSNNPVSDDDIPF